MRMTAINPETLNVPAAQPIEALLSVRLGVPVRALNDAQPAAWGEFRRRAGRDGARYKRPRTHCDNSNLIGLM
jgi:predicted NBD/HSP70 family sugar kinase